MKKFIVLFLLFCGFVYADEPRIRFSGEMRSKYELSDRNDFSIRIKSGARYQYNSLNVITEVQTEYNANTDYEFFVFNINKAYFVYAITDYTSVTIGRDKLKDMFESKIQYGSKFNGACFNIEFNKLSLKTAAFIPGYEGYYAACSQVQVQPFDFPLSLAYSLSFWDSKQEMSNQFLVSQVTCKLFLNGRLTGLPIMLTGGWAVNNKAETKAMSHYAGIEFGNPFPQYKNDWQVAIVAKEIGRNSIPYPDRQALYKKGYSGNGIAVEAIYLPSDRFVLKGGMEAAWIDQDYQERSNSYSMSATCKF